MKRLIIVLSGFLLAAGVASAIDPVGHVVYLTGEPQAIRGARPLWLGVGLGLPVRSYDFFHTGGNELIEIETTGETGVQAMIRVQPDTTLYLDLYATVREQRIRLLRGAVSVFMGEGESRLVVAAGPLRVESAGADFAATIAPGGAVLVTASRGVARVNDGTGRILFADAERAVELQPGGVFRTVPVLPYRDDRFRSVWRSQAEAEIAFDRDSVYRRHVDAYEAVAPRFAEAYRNLLARRDIIDRWMETDRQGRDPRFGDDPAVTVAESRELHNLLAEAGSALTVLEQSWYQLSELSPFTENARIIEDQMHTVRAIQRLYALRNHGSLDEPGTAQR